MATNNMAEGDLDSHKRKIFVQNISPETTKQSLKDYFSKYFSEHPFQWSAVPLDEKGKNRMHGIVMFYDRKSVDAVMSQRVHRIDGKEVFIHRSVPTERSAKDKHGIEQLIVSALNNQSLVETDVKNYFVDYGKICSISHIKNDGNIWVIDFDYYDAVDQILLDSPHYIGRIEVSVKKGDRNVACRRSPPPGPIPKTHNNDNNSEITSKSNLKKVTLNEQVAYLNLPAKNYCIHITNLPNNIDAESLSEQFDWDIYDIVMDPSVGVQGLTMQCWLKNANDEREVDNFVRFWNKKSISGSIIHCEKEEDELELCNKFQFGQCRKSSDECHWKHVPCTAEGTCSSTCPYGHGAGMKSEHDASNGRATMITDYRVKISGFKIEVTPQNLIEKFGSNNYYVDRKHARVGYVVKIKTMKYAKKLMTEWHNTEVNGDKIKCQLELNPIAPANYNHPRSRPASIDGEPKRQRSRSRPRDTHSVQSSQNTSELGNADNIMSITVDNREVDRDRRISGKALSDITRSLSKTNLNHASSSESITSPVDTKYQLPSNALANEWEITNKGPNSDGKVLLIRGKVDRKRLAIIKIYPNQSLSDFRREITAINDLKGTKGVSQLIEPENASNNLTQRRVNNDNLWMIMERASGYSLKEFIERKCQGVLEVSAAIQLTLNLLGILQQVHNKGIFNQNLSPENIMIEWDLKSSIDRAQLTVLNFSQAVIVSDGPHRSVAPLTQKWYYAPQTNEGGLSATVDSSGICAVLFWLLTQIDPRHDNDNLPHHLARDKFNDMFKSGVKSTNMNRQMSLEEQLKLYLIDTFDRAFGYPHHHPWTLNDLQCRLESILQLLKPVEPKLNTTDAIFQALISISDSLSTPPIVVDVAQRGAFEKASKAFCQAKKNFLENGKNQYEWSNEGCTWVHSPHSSINECRSDDVLTYHSARGRTTTSYSIIITCWAICSEEGRVMTLSISSNVNGKTIQMPIGQYSTAQDYITNVQENFKTELINLLLAVYKERKPVQH